MLFASLDEIVKRSLIDRNLPIHFYFEYLSHAAAAIRELSFDTLRIVNTVNLPLNDYHAADLPDDFVDDVSVGIPAGQFIQPVVRMDQMTPLRYKNPTTGQFEDYSNASNNNVTVDGLYLNPGWMWFWNVNDFGESTGRSFGGNGGSTRNGYKIVKERRQIQFTESFTSDMATLIYISDGQSADNASTIDVQAFAAVQAYIGWKTSLNRDIKDSPQAATFYNERRLLRARLNPLDILGIRQILHNAYSATIKN